MSAKMQMTPQEIVHELDKHIVGQQGAKKAVAIALRNRWRRAQVERTMLMPMICISGIQNNWAEERSSIFVDPYG